MHAWLRSRLAGMMFLQYFLMGLWSVTFSTYLLAHPADGGLALTGRQVGLIYSTMALAGTLSPFFVGLIADRLFPAQRVLAALHLGGAAVTFAIWRYVESRHLELRELASTLNPSLLRAEADRSFPPLFGLMLLNAFCYMPTITLTNAIAFRKLPVPERQFAGVRVFGTIGWLVAGVFVGLTLPRVSATALLFSSMASLALAVYCPTLPYTAPNLHPHSLGDRLGLPALKMLARPRFRTFVITSVTITFFMSFHNLYLNRYMVDLGVRRAAAWQTIGQFAEVVCILLIPALIDRVGVKWTLLAGLLASFVRYVMYASGSVAGLLSFGVPMHGVCYSFYFIAAALFVDRNAPRDLRASAQGLVSLLTLGVGAFAGNFFAGWVLDRSLGSGRVDWVEFWGVPAVGSALATLFFALRFREHEAVDAAAKSKVRAAQGMGAVS